MRAGKHDGLPLSHRLANLLLVYRSTPHATTQRPPSSLFLGRTIRTCLDLLRPNLQERVQAKQSLQKDQHDQHARSRSLEAGQPVMVKNLLSGDSWIPGVVLKQLGPVSFLVDVGEGRTWKRHLDHLKVRDLPEPVVETPEAPVVPEHTTMEPEPAPRLAVPALDRTVQDDPVVEPAGPGFSTASSLVPTSTPDRSTPTPDRTSSPASVRISVPNSPVPAPRRYPERQHHMPDYLRYN